MLARFLLSTLTEFPMLKDPLGHNLPEIVLAGRSNVGKSSLINHLLSQKKLAKTSGTPGKTRLLNFFAVDEKFLLVDSPGYGYAKAPRDEAHKWSKAIDAYLNHRPTLRLILLLIDSRRDFSREDQILAEWAMHKCIPILVILTKTDKLSKAAKSALVKKHPEAVLYSIKNADSRPILKTRIQQIVWG